MSGSQPTYKVGVKRDQMVTMRDGARMAVDIYRPYGQGEAFPALLATSPYGKDFDYLPSSPMFRFRETGPIEWYVERGYAFIHADTRGSGKSEGTFMPLDPASQTDLYDMVEWIADQPWCSGKVGMIGASYYGVSQWLAAAQKPPRLFCIAPYDAFVDPYRDYLYHGGIPCQFQMWWNFDVRARRLLDYPERHFGKHHLGEGIARRIAEAPAGALKQAGVQALVKARRLAHTIKPGLMSQDAVYAMLTNPLDGPAYWIPAAYTKFDRINVPFYSIADLSSWGLHLRGNILAYEMIAAPKKLLIQGAVGAPQTWPLLDCPDFSQHSQEVFGSLRFHEELLRWYDHWLKGVANDIMEEPPVKYWIQGRGEFATAPSWPPPGVVYKPLYLQAGTSRAVSSLNDGVLTFHEPAAAQPPTRLKYPDALWSGTPGLGTAVLSPSGVPDRCARILTFTSEPLGRELQIAGPISLKLFAASDQTDTDFFVRLCDQPPHEAEDDAVLQRMQLSPPACVVSRGWLRASHRELDRARSKPARPWHSHQRGEPLQPGTVYEFDIEIWPTSWLFHRQHRLRLELAPGDSSYFDAPYFHYYGVKMGTDTFYHDSKHPSHLLLPVVS